MYCYAIIIKYMTAFYLALTRVFCTYVISFRNRNVSVDVDVDVDVVCATDKKELQRKRIKKNILYVKNKAK